MSSTFPNAEVRSGPLGSRLGFRRLLRVRRVGLAPLVSITILAVFYLSAVFAPLIAPHDPREQDLSLRLLPPVWAEGGTLTYPLGTDQLGRDELSRLIWGARVTATVITTALITAAVVGTAAGMIAGYFRGAVEMIVMRLVDVQLSIPTLILAIALAGALGPGIRNLYIVLVIWSWAPIARVVRSDVLSEQARDYVTAAEVIGCSPLRIMYRHLLPNIMSTVLVLATLEVGRFIVFEAGLSFLGLGVQNPSPAWGSMLADGRTYIVDAWWLPVVPGVAILLVSLAGNLLGDFLTDRFDPRLRGL